MPPWTRSEGFPSSMGDREPKPMPGEVAQRSNEREEAIRHLAVARLRAKTVKNG